MKQADVMASNTDISFERISVLKAEHAALKRRLADFESQRFLSASEQVERRRLQKMKLRAKDDIALLEQDSS